MIWLLVALMLDRAQLKIAATNYGTRYNGYGAIPSVLDRSAKRPMVERVLVPWLVWLLERLPGHDRFVSYYEPVKIALMALALFFTSRVPGVGERGALLVAAMLPATFLYDYWDWAPELMGFAGCLSGNWWLAVVGVIVHSLSRETAILAPVAYALATGDWLGMLVLAFGVLAIQGMVKVVQGQHPLYCERLQVGRNIADLRAMMHARPYYLSPQAMSVIITALTLYAIATGVVAWPVALVLLAAGWLLGVAKETRVFTACLLWVALAIA